MATHHFCSNHDMEAKKPTKPQTPVILPLITCKRKMFSTIFFSDISLSVWLLETEVKKKSHLAVDMASKHSDVRTEYISLRASLDPSPCSNFVAKKMIPQA